MNAEEVARGGKRSNGRGSTDNKKRLDAFRKKAASKGEADWSTAVPEHIVAVVVAATHVGGAVTFGLSRDGGAYMLTLLMDGDRQTLWFNGDCDLAYELQAVYETLEDMR